MIEVRKIGFADGLNDKYLVGNIDDTLDGDTVGLLVGFVVGRCIGGLDGSFDTDWEGASV